MEHRARLGEVELDGLWLRSVSVRDRDTTVYKLRLRGELDLGNAPAARAALAAIVSQLDATAASVDLTQLEFLDLAGVRVLTDAADRLRARGIAVEVCAAPGSAPARVLGLLDITSSLAWPRDPAPADTSSPAAAGADCGAQ